MGQIFRKNVVFVPEKTSFIRNTFSFDIIVGCVFDTLTDLITPKLPTKLRSNLGSLYSLVAL